MHRRPTRIVREAILAALVLCGCATVAPVNVPVGRAEPEAGYRIAKLLGRHRGPANNPDALVFLAFFGGGPRAVALSYGVLEELRRTPIMVKGHPHSMLDEVDLVAGVSGGSSRHWPMRSTASGCSTSIRIAFSSATFKAS
jgi:NTE family protein